MLFGPTFLADRQEEHLQMSAEITTNLMAGVISETGWEANGASVREVFDSMRSTHHLTYLVLTNDTGAVLGSVNEVGARHLKYNLSTLIPNEFKKTGLVRSTKRVALTDSTHGTLYVGISDPEFVRVKRAFRGQSMAVGLVLLFLSAGLFYALRDITIMESRVYSLRKAQKDLSQQKGSLQSKVEEHQKTTAELKESEQRYRYLLENAMTSAFSDLEALNKNLERQKAELEIEVDQKTKAQASLASYADRLASLNAIERLLVSEVPLQTIVEKALQQIQKLINCSHITILQVDQNSGSVEILGSCGNGLKDERINELFSLSAMRDSGKPWLYLPDIRVQENNTPVETLLVENGLYSYGRATLTIGEALVGALIVCGSQVDAFNDSDITAVRDIADLISLGLSQQQHRLERERYELDLITERDRAEEMARLKTAFLANMSHEIRTPLSGIIGFAQVLHEEVQEEQQEFTGLIQDAAKRLMNTINSVLDLSKLEALKAPLQTDLLDLSEVVVESTSLLKPLALKKHIDFNVRAEAGISCRVDRGAVQSIVNNIVGNAIKFTETGSVSVLVERIQNDACLRVKDTGAGISSDFIPFLFDEFRQEHMGSDRPHEGSGLGLAIAQKLVLRLGGRIDVESELGQGTTFNVYIPMSPLAGPLESNDSPATNVSNASAKSAPRESKPIAKRGAQSVITSAAS